MRVNYIFVALPAARTSKMAPRSTSKLSQVKESNCLLGQEYPAGCLSLNVLSRNNILPVLAVSWLQETAGDVITISVL